MIKKENTLPTVATHRIDERDLAHRLVTDGWSVVIATEATDTFPERDANVRIAFKSRSPEWAANWHLVTNLRQQPADRTAYALLTPTASDKSDTYESPKRRSPETEVHETVQVQSGFH